VTQYLATWALDKGTKYVILMSVLGLA
jgi:hypothetical protein